MVKRGPRALFAADPRGRAALRDLLRKTRRNEARTNRLLSLASPRIVGVFYRDREGGKVVPANRRNREEYRVRDRDAGGAEDGELVRAEQLPTGGPVSREPRSSNGWDT